MPALLLICCLLLAPLLRADEVRLASLDYPPFTGTELREGGRLVALARAALAREGLTLRVDYLPWARVMLEVERGHYDGGLPFWPREITELGLTASRPLVYSEMGFFVRRGSPLAGQPLEAMQGRRVGIVRGYGYPRHILESGIVPEEAANDLSNLRKLAAGRFDLVLLERAVGLHLLQRHADLRPHLQWQGRMLERIPLVAGFRPEHPRLGNLAERFDRGLKGLMEDGQYLRILQQPDAP